MYGLQKEAQVWMNKPFGRQISINQQKSQKQTDTETVRLVAGTAGLAQGSPFADASGGQRAPSTSLSGVLRAADNTLNELSRAPGSTYNRTAAGVDSQALTGRRDISRSDALQGRSSSGNMTRPSGTRGGGNGGTYDGPRYTLQSDEDVDDDVRGQAALDPRPLLGGGRGSSYDSSPSRGPSSGGGRGSDTGAVSL